MQGARHEAEEDDDDTPPTRPYVDALLHGSLSAEQVASLRAEIASRAAEETALLARSYPAPPPRSGWVAHPSTTPVPSSFGEAHPSSGPVTMGGDPPYPPARPVPVRPRPVEAHTDDEESGLTRIPASSTGESAGAGPAAGEEYEELLDDIYFAALGGAESVPSLAVPAARMAELPLGPQAAFVLSRIDGYSSVEDVIDMSSLTRLETLRILYGLLEQGIIRVAG